MQRTNNIPAGAVLDISILARPDLGDMAQDWAEWLEGVQQCRDRCYEQGFESPRDQLAGELKAPSAQKMKKAGLDAPEKVELSSEIQ